MAGSGTGIPLLDLSWAHDASKKAELLEQLRSALFDIGFLYITNHGVEQASIDGLTDMLPALFDLPLDQKAEMSKLNSPHFLGYSGFAEETTLGKQDLREQFDFATELPVVYQPRSREDSAESKQANDQNNADNEQDAEFGQLYWRLRGPNQWPAESSLPGFRKSLTRYHDEVQELSYRFVHLIEEAFDIPVGTFDHFFSAHSSGKLSQDWASFLPPQHRIKLLKYPPANADSDGDQGVGAHKDSSGWLTFLYQVGNEPGLEVLSPSGDWLPVTPVRGSFVVNFGNAMEAATCGAVKATIHRVISPGPTSNVRYSIPFFQGLPLDMSVSEVQRYIPEKVRMLRRQTGRMNDETQSFLDPRWDSLGESQLRKWIRSHKDVAMRWYGAETVAWYTASD